MDLAMPPPPPDLVIEGDNSSPSWDKEICGHDC